MTQSLRSPRSLHQRLAAHEPSRGSGDTAPLAFTQMGMWFYDQLYPGDPLYHVAAAWRLRGPLVVEALRKALDAVVARQPILRTRFVAPNEMPEQQIVSSAAFPLAEVAAPDADTALMRCVDEARRPFQLDRGPPLARGLVVQLDPLDHVLMLSFHHIIWDWRSMELLFAELAHGYASALGGNAQASAPLAVTYADFARWQHDVLTPAALEQERRHWRERLADLPPLALSTDREHPLRRSNRGARIWRPQLIDASTVAALRAQCRETQSTLFTALLTAYAAMLYRDAAQERFAVGFPVAGRESPALEPLMGCFINMLVLVADFSGEPSYATALARVREALIDALDNRDVPFNTVVSDLGRRPDLRRSPVFNVMLNYRNRHAPELRLHELDVTPLPLDIGIAKYDQNLELHVTEHGVDARMQFNVDVYDRVTIEGFLDRFAALLRDVALEPQRPLGSLPIY